MTRERGEELRGNVFGGETQVERLVLGTGGQIAANERGTAANWRLTIEIMEQALAEVVESVAMRLQNERLAGGDVVTAEVVEAGVGNDLQVLGCSEDEAADTDTSTPPAISAINQTSELTELSLVPPELEAHGSFAQLGGALPTAFKLNGPGVAEIGIGADGLGFQSHAPFVLSRRPEGEVGFAESE